MPLFRGGRLPGKQEPTKRVSPSRLGDHGICVARTWRPVPGTARGSPPRRNSFAEHPPTCCATATPLPGAGGHWASPGASSGPAGRCLVAHRRRLGIPRDPHAPVLRAQHSAAPDPWFTSPRLAGPPPAETQCPPACRSTDTPIARCNRRGPPLASPARGEFAERCGRSTVP